MGKLFIVECRIMDGNKAASIKSKCNAYYDFETAKAEFRARLKDYSKANGSKILNDYINGLKDPGMGDYDEETEDLVGGEEWYSFVEAIITGENPAMLLEQLQRGCNGNYMFAWELTDGSYPVLNIYGDDEGPCNGVDPQMHTNAIVMDDPTMDYYCYFQVHNDYVDEEDQTYVGVDLHVVNI